MNQQEHEETAELLLEVYASRRPVEPLTAKFAGLTVDDAYEIQLLQIRRWLAGGAEVKGHKVGLTSAAMQRQLGVDQPDYGHLLDRMFWLEYEPIPISRFLQPRVEPEMAFVLARPLRGRARGVVLEAGARDPARLGDRRGPGRRGGHRDRDVRGAGQRDRPVRCRRGDRGVRARATAAIAGLYSPFLLHAQRAADRYGVPAHVLLQRAGEAATSAARRT